MSTGYLHYLEDASEAGEPVMFSLNRALNELSAHGIDSPEEFYKEFGLCKHYSALEVLYWLGY